ncbi:hypothetical protein JW930_02785 [Candidatus Woesearchaeota archaeon]|nr:hypothetical protein [Candidatus Woesearchaeota archaeon]
MEKEDSKLKNITAEVDSKIQQDLTSIKLSSSYFGQIKEIVEDSSIEDKKKNLFNEIKSSTDSSVLKQVKTLNEQAITPMIFTLLNNIEKLDLKEIKLEKINLETEKKADKILLGLYNILSQKIKKDTEIEQYLGKGEEGLKAIDLKLSKVEEIDKENSKKLGLLKNELREYKQTINEQTRIINKLINTTHGSAISRMLSQKIDPGHQITLLMSLYSKEIAEHNKIIKTLGDIKLKDNQDENNEILMFESKELDIDNDLRLLMHQYIIPKLKFPSRIYIAYGCSVQEAVGILNNCFLDLPIHNEFFKIGASEIQLNYFLFYINQVTHYEQSEIIFISPLEAVLANRIFNLSENIVKIYSLTEKPVELAEKTYELLEKEMDRKFKEWTKEAEKLNENFKEGWTEEAEKMIEKNFTEKWMNDGNQDFSTKYGLDILNLILLMKIYEEKLARPDKKVNKENLIDEISKFSKNEFTKKSKEAKSFEEDSVKQAKQFYEAKGIDTDESLILIPRNYVLYFEKYFEKTKRPKVFYYEGQPNIEKAIEKCNSEKQKKELPKLNPVRIINADTYQPLQTIQ